MRGWPPPGDCAEGEASRNSEPCSVVAKPAARRLAAPRYQRLRGTDAHGMDGGGCLSSASARLRLDCGGSHGTSVVEAGGGRRSVTGGGRSRQQRVAAEGSGGQHPAIRGCRRRQVGGRGSSLAVAGGEGAAGAVAAAQQSGQRPRGAEEAATAAAAAADRGGADAAEGVGRVGSEGRPGDPRTGTGARSSAHSPVLITLARAAGRGCVCSRPQPADRLREGQHVLRLQRVGAHVTQLAHPRSGQLLLRLRLLRLRLLGGGVGCWLGRERGGPRLLRLQRERRRSPRQPQALGR